MNSLAKREQGRPHEISRLLLAVEVGGCQGVEQSCAARDSGKESGARGVPVEDAVGDQTFLWVVVLVKGGAHNRVCGRGPRAPHKKALAGGLTESKTREEEASYRG